MEKEPMLLSGLSIADAEKELRKIDMSEQAVKIMAPKAVFRVVKLFNVRNAAANILKQEMLSVGGEAAVSQYTVDCSKERTDVLVMGTLKQFQVLIAKMKTQGYFLSEEKNSEYRRMAESMERLLKQEK